MGNMKKRVLYLGLDPSRFITDGIVTHYPVIKIVPRDLPALDFTLFDTIIFTSRSSVKILAPHLKCPATMIAVGKATAALLKEFGFSCLLPENETAEGVVDILKSINIKNALYLHSSRARDVIGRYLKINNITCVQAPLYDTVIQQTVPIPSLDLFDEIVFTSPSTVDAFLEIFKQLPQNKILTPIGPITKRQLGS